MTSTKEFTVWEVMTIHSILWQTKETLLVHAYPLCGGLPAFLCLDTLRVSPHQYYFYGHQCWPSTHSGSQGSSPLATAKTKVPIWYNILCMCVRLCACKEVLQITYCESLITRTGVRTQIGLPSPLVLIHTPHI